MLSTFRMLVLLTGLSPLFLVSDSLMMRAFVGVYVALMVVMVAWSIRPGEAAFLSSLIWPAALLALVPAAWLLIQALPMPVSGLRHPIWISAQAALGRTILGSISASPGDTIVALARYLSVIAVFFVASAVTIDRQRAETVLFMLAGLTTILAALLIIHDLGGFLFLGEISAGGPRTAVTAAAALGTIFTSAVATYAIERYEMRKNRGDFGLRLFIIIVSGTIGAFAVCWIAIAFFSSNAISFAAGCGVGTYVLIIGLRRVGVRPKMGFLVMAFAVAVPISLIGRDPSDHSLDLALRFTNTSSKPVLDLTQRMIGNTSGFGSGAGTFSALLPLYQEASRPIAIMTAPTTAANLLIELGRPALWLIVIATLAAIAWLIMGTFQRGRDSFFTAAGASCAVILLIEAFLDASLTGTTIILIAASALGLALSQSTSRKSA